MKDFILKLLAPSPKHDLVALQKFRGATMMVGDSIGNQVAMKLGVFNRCQPGDRAQDAWRRFPYDHRIGDVLVIQHGTNDLPANIDPTGYIEKMAHYAWEEGRMLVFTGMSVRDDYDVSDYNLRIMELAYEFGAPYADWGNVPIVRPDGLHPDDASAQLLADATLDAILHARK